MSVPPAPCAATATASRARLPHGALLGVGTLVAAAFAAVATGLVEPPDLEGALTDLTATLGPWTARSAQRPTP